MPVKGSGSELRARRIVSSAWLCPPYPFAPCRRIVQRVAGTTFFYLQNYCSAIKSISFFSQVFRHLSKKFFQKLLPVKLDFSSQIFANLQLRLPPIACPHRAGSGLFVKARPFGRLTPSLTRWLLLKNSENLSISNNEAEKLKEALKMNEPLALAYYMKEDLRQFWEQSDKDAAEKVIDDWIERAQKSEIRPLRKMAGTVAMFKFGILNWYDHPVSSGRLEGTNNKIKVFKRMAYGYRDVEFFKPRIMAIHEAKYAFNG